MGTQARCAILYGEIDHLGGATYDVLDSIVAFAFPDDLDGFTKRTCPVLSDVPIDQRFVEMDVWLDEAWDRHCAMGIDGFLCSLIFIGLYEATAVDREIARLAVSPWANISDQDIVHSVPLIIVLGYFTSSRASRTRLSSRSQALPQALMLHHLNDAES